MRRSVFAIWVGLLVLGLGSASLRFLLFGLQNPVPSIPGLVFNFVVVIILILAVWILTLRFIERRHRRQAARLEVRFPGSVTFPSLPTAELAEAARRIEPELQLDDADALTVLVDGSGVSLWRRGGDSTARLLDLPRADVLGVSSRSVAWRFGAHPSIAVVLPSDDGLTPFVFPLFQPDRPFRRARMSHAEDIARRSTVALG